MTYDGGKPHPVGDRGQRFEVSVYDDDKGERIICGWTDSAEDASKMATSFAKRPGWSLEQVRDRQPVGAEQPLVKLRIKLTKAEKEIERLQARVDELEEALAVSKHETGTVDNALYKYEVLWSNCKGWREFDWPEGFCRRTADLIVENAERMLAKTGRYPVTIKDTNVKALEGEGK